jgi:hypothetical protein
VSGNRKSSAREQPRRALEARLRRKEPVRQARITNAVLGQAIIEYLNGYRGGTHSLAKSRIV